MKLHVYKLNNLIALLLVAFAADSALAAKEDLGNGFLHHGVATPVSNHRGTVATVDGEGRNIVLVWLYDHRGNYGLLLIDTETGKSEQFPMPFPYGGDAPFASVLSSGNKFYTHFGRHFVEFDPVKRAYTFHHKTSPKMAMGMTEDDNGIIWAFTYPNCGVVSFDPKTRELKDYGYMNKENWSQYPSYVASDDTGWVYCGLGNTNSHIIGFDRFTGKAKPMIPESERVQACAMVYRDINGKVYGTPSHIAPESDRKWYELYNGKATRIAKPTIKKKPIITSSQTLFHPYFPDGKQLEKCDLVKRVLTVKDPKTKKVKKIKFNYTSEGAPIMGMTVAPNNTICGGTTFPMRFFSYKPETDKWINEACEGQWNTVVRQGNRFFAGSYPYGKLLEWNPATKWVETKPGNPQSNPLFLIQCNPTVLRPHDLLAHPDGKTIVMSGTPAYGYTGGGLLFWDRKTSKSTLIEHTDILLEHSTMSLLALPGGKLLGGSTTNPGTGGERKAEQAELYIMDMGTKKIEWHQPLLPGVQAYTDMCTGSEGFVYGLADRQLFFVFDPAKRKVIHQMSTKAEFGTTSGADGPRNFVLDPEGTIYILFAECIARVEPGTFKITMLAKSPVKGIAGGDYYKGRIYFASGSHLYSYKVPAR